MSRLQPRRTSRFARMIRKSFVSAFVAVTYVAYALHERFAGPTANTLAQAPEPTRPPATQSSADALQGQSKNQFARPANPTAEPVTQAAPALTAGSQGQFKNGTFTGARENAFYGQVQVQVVIQDGKISNVQFLDYPKDRRTSARSNSIAIPYLQSEAIQAQSANVDIISGATLTSEAFMASLQTALDSARS
jgi:uncharacterized protein with FMN-binding domain